MAFLSRIGSLTIVLELVAITPLVAQESKPLKVGIIGLDTSHVMAFTKEFNNPDAKEDIAGCKVIAAYPKGSPDIESSTSRIAGYTTDIGKLGVEIVDSEEALVKRVDCVLLETN